LFFKIFYARRLFDIIFTHTKIKLYIKMATVKKATKEKAEKPAKAPAKKGCCGGKKK